MIYWVENANVVLGYLFKEIHHGVIGIVNILLPSKKSNNNEIDFTVTFTEQNECLSDIDHETFYGVEKIISQSILKLSDAELRLQKEQLLAEIDACLE